jgi:4-hydroxy-3-methylbut-2-enyl diphosphate reductase
MGVRRAVDMVLEAPNKYPEPIYTFGPVIHNPQVLSLLQEKGICVLESLPERGEGTVLIRAHGVPPESKRQLSQAGFRVLDATCPRVAKVQQIIKHHVSRGAAAIILGDPDHPEVVGLLACAGDKGYVVSSLEELQQLPEFEQAVVVQQTTQSTALYRECTRWIEERLPHYRVFSTICDSTERRQSEVREMAPSVDAMIVVGGRQSGNTKRLAEISRECGLPTYHIETAAELPSRIAREAETVGITAGASTPNWIIKDVHRKLQRLPSRKRYLLSETSVRLQRFLLLTNLWVAFGAACLCYGCGLLLQARSVLLPALIAFFYVHSMHTLNHLTGGKADKYNDPERGEFYETHRVMLGSLAGVTGGAALAAAYAYGWLAFGLIAAMSLLGLLYNLPIPAPGMRTGNSFKIKDIPGSKTFLITLAWAAVTALIPALHQVPPLGQTAAVFLLSASLVFVRTAFFDILDMQGDRIVGRETLPLLLGEKRTIRHLKTLLALVLAGLAAAAAFRVLPPFGYVLLMCPVFLFLVLALYNRRRMLPEIWLEFLVESHFALIGLLALIWSLLA